MKFRDPETGEFKELYTKAADTLPVGTVVDFDGTEIPAGWEEVEDIPIIESGSNDNGAYVKFSDGTMICRARKTITATVNSPWGSLYTSELLEALTYPMKFTGTPRISFEVESPRTVWKMFSGVGNNITTPKYYLTSAVSTNLDYFDVEYIAIGRWK